jgi:acetoin utilization deacetylase AcuC-like enzyme
VSNPIPVVLSDAHLAHAGLIELAGGREIPCWESPERAVAIEAELRARGDCTFEAPTEHGRGPILAVHDAALVEIFEHAWTDALAAGATDGSRSLIPDTYLLAAYAGPMKLGVLPAGAHHRLGAYLFDTATPIVAGTWGAALAAVDVALTAAERVVGGAPLAYGLCRPPGHHAARGMLGGYCYFNNAAIVAEWLRRGGAHRVAILDIDYHHGNGTQQIFWRRGDVFYASIHADPDRAYPFYLGRADETGEGPGAGANLNLPLPAGSDNERFLGAVDQALEAIAATAGSVIVVSLGFDTYGHDPIGDFALTTDVYHEVGRRVAALGRRLVILQEGGYHRPSLGENARAWLRGAEDRAFDPLPVAGFTPRGSKI